MCALCMRTQKVQVKICVYWSSLCGRDIIPVVFRTLCTLKYVLVLKARKVLLALF